MSNVENPLTILQITDLHLLPHLHDTMLGIDTEYYFQRVLEHAFANQYQFDLILISGDLAQNPTSKSYLRVSQALSLYNIPVICFPGNHDDWPLMQRIFNSALMSCDKHHLFQHWQLICLNSQKLTDPSGYLAPEELDFLSTCLTENPDYHTVVALHHHCRPSHSQWLDTMVVENHHELFARLQAFPQVKLIVHGHIHQDLEDEYQNIKILASPSTCFQFKPRSKDFALDHASPGYRVIQLSPEGHIASQVYRLDVQQDELHVTCAGY